MKKLKQIIEILLMILTAITSVFKKKSTWRKVIDYAITILTAIVTTLTTTSCM